MFLTKQLINVEQNDPKTFWKIIDKMNNWGKINWTHQITFHLNYFQELLNDKSMKTSEGKFEDNFNTL